MELDTFPGLLSHLATLALVEDDMRRHALLLSLIERSGPGVFLSTSGDRYAAAIVAKDPVAVRNARDLYAAERNAGGSVFLWPVEVLVPARELDSLLSRLESLSTTQDQRLRTKAMITTIASNGGQPARAAAARRERERLGADSIEMDLDVLFHADPDSAAIDRLSRAFASILPFARCEVTLARLRRADTSGAEALVTTFRAPPSNSLRRVCADVIEGIASALTPTSPLTALQRVDSLLRSMPAGANPNWNYDVALAFARRGEWKSAAAASRRRLFARRVRLAISLRDEGRWSALAGDTTNAIRAFRQYLGLRENPEPSLVPERDSIRAELARLQIRRPVTN